MIAASALSALDRALASNGEIVTLRRLTGDIAFDVECRAIVRGEVPDERRGDQVQDDSRVIISASEIVAAQWPGPRPESLTDTRDWRVPVPDDQIRIAGRWRYVEEAMPIYLRGALVRISLKVRG